MFFTAVDGVLTLDGAEVEPGVITTRDRVVFGGQFSTAPGSALPSSYHGLSEQGRGAFVEFIGGHRDDPNAPEGFVQMYASNLERRVLADLPIDDADSRTAEIAAEFRRLRSVYQHRREFVQSVNRVLALIEAGSLVQRDLTPPIDMPADGAQRTPLVLLVGLARYAHARQPIPATWAYAAAIHNPYQRLPKQVRSCPDEFRALFELRYSQRSRHAIRLSTDSFTTAGVGLTLDYRPLSRKLDPQRITTELPIIDPRHVREWWNDIHTIATACANELKPFATAIARKPSMPRSCEHALLLPRELFLSFRGPLVDDLFAYLWQMVRESTTPTVTFSELSERFLPGHRGALTRRQASVLSQTLERLGFGIEPDVRYGGATPDPGIAAAVFYQPGNAGEAELPPQYWSAAALATCAMVLATTSGPVERTQRDRILEAVLAHTPLPAPAIRRLTARLDHLAASPPTLATARTWLKRLNPQLARTAARAVVDSAVADAELNRAAQKVRAKVLELLGAECESS